MPKTTVPAQNNSATISATNIDQRTAFFHGRFEFVTSADYYHQLPVPDQPEIAVIGRSNCGKSSLLNSLMGHKNLARTSNTPGRTRLFNLFAIRDTLSLLDLPGYGFAKASAQARQHWAQQWQSYIQHRKHLRHVLLLVDARRGLMPIDQETMAVLDRYGSRYTIVLTKCDKVPHKISAALPAKIQPLLLHHPAASGEVMLSSAKTYWGIDLLRQKILQHTGLLSPGAESQATPHYAEVIDQLIKTRTIATKGKELNER